ncbi:HTH-type transcriptional regulator LutR [Clavibacter michiganensis subsp. michiganensis]|uniref:HTH-type transcriptional regulator LutR n=1 Tax=Clavibacter michiganensis subsp. michiganensis TaxID=33013 RepID=A0A251XMC5_CLAMM|nr:HTH-type transcriptional regulator LutR [Clavibacter michiganensis subsp. michiganensis]OUE04363.1 HTH-type transcriptional regulator LutR [Clavibacter michiganensis subsp. michiganensis]
MLATRIIEELGRDIVDGRLAEGTRLTIEDLQRRFGVSRTVVRDCVRVLEAMALIVPKRRVGLVVQGPDRWNVYDPRIIRWRLTGPGRSDQFRSLTQLRRAVEPVAASLAARNATAGQRTRIAELAVDLRRLGEAGALVDFLAADIEFHHLILQASGNDMFCALREVITEVLSGRTHQGLMPRTRGRMRSTRMSRWRTRSATGMRRRRRRGWRRCWRRSAARSPKQAACGRRRRRGRERCDGRGRTQRRPRGSPARA